MINIPQKPLVKLKKIIKKMLMIVSKFCLNKFQIKKYYYFNDNLAI